MNVTVAVPVAVGESVTVAEHGVGVLLTVTVRRALEAVPTAHDATAGGVGAVGLLPGVAAKAKVLVPCVPIVTAWLLATGGLTTRLTKN